jgi:hypothetical protein
MDNIKNKYELITLEWIANYIDELYEPHKVYGKPDELKKNAEKYNIPNGNYNEKLEILNIVYNGKDSYAIYKPKSNEIDKIKMFREIEYKRSKLIELRNLQIEFLNKNLKKPQETEVEKKIDLILEELNVKIKVEKQEVDIFVSKEAEKIIIDLLIENDFIRINSGKLEWIGSGSDTHLRLKTMLCYLFMILKKKNYLKNNVKNIEIDDYSNTVLNCSVGAGYFGRLFKANANVDIDKIRKGDTRYEYFGLFHFIKMKTL